MKRFATVLATTALATSGMLGAAPAHAASTTCTPVVVAAATAVPQVLGIPHDIIDVAAASATCVDLGLGNHTAFFVVKWFYSGGQMPACPSTVVQLTLVDNTPVQTVAGVGLCQRPASSPATTSPRSVTVELWVDNLFYSSGSSPVLLSP